MAAVIPPDELRHLRQGPRRNETPGGAGLIEVVAHGASASEVLTRVREVLETVIGNSESAWPSVDGWSRLLPGWFVASSAPVQTTQTAEEWLAWWRELPPAERDKAEREQSWSLTDWLYWMQPNNREWFWWGAEVVDDRTVKARIEVPGWPAPVGALEWLLKAAGSNDVRQPEMLR